MWLREHFDGCAQVHSDVGRGAGVEERVLPGPGLFLQQHQEQASETPRLMRLTNERTQVWAQTATGQVFVDEQCSRPKPAAHKGPAGSDLSPGQCRLGPGAPLLDSFQRKGGPDIHLTLLEQTSELGKWEEEIGMRVRGQGGLSWETVRVSGGKASFSLLFTGCETLRVPQFTHWQSTFSRDFQGL